MLRPTLSHHRRGRRGFTLVELMISIAIALVLIVGVNAVFRMASDAVGAGQALSAAQRGDRDIQSTVFADLKSAVTKDPPFFIIQSETTAAFRNAADEASDKDYDRTETQLATVQKRMRTVDLDGDGKEDGPGETLPLTAVNYRNHRVDQLRFFATGNFTRQTGNAGSLSSSMSSSEAMVWYGHVTQPRDMKEGLAKTDAANKPRKPGPEAPEGVTVAAETASSNPNNFYASQWALGRFVVLLREPETQGNLRVILERPGAPVAGNPRQYYIARLGANLSPLSWNSTVSLSGQRNEYESGDATPRPIQIQDSRYDLAGTSIQVYKKTFNDWFAAATAAQRQGWADNAFNYRFMAYPYPTRPVTAAAAARTVPIFLPACSQFIVEFAGDFVTQAIDGSVTAVSPDGEIDFFLQPDNAGLLPAPTPANRDRWRRNIRWYGFPRDIDGDGIIKGVAGGNVHNNELADVVPVRDVANTAPAAFRPGANGLAFEKEMDTNLKQQANYTQLDPSRAVNRYTVAWGDPTTVNFGLPRMIRLTIALDDPNGRLGESQTYEYVVELPN